MLITALGSLWDAAPEARPIFICLCGKEEKKKECRNVRTAVNEFSYAYKRTYFV